MIRKVITKPKVKVRKLSKREEDGSLTKMLTLEVNGLNKLHSIEEPALVNKEQRIKEYYLHGIKYPWEIWNEIKKGREGLPPSKKPAPKGFTNRS